MNPSTMEPPETPSTRAKRDVFYGPGFPANESDIEHRPAWPDEGQQLFRLLTWLLLITFLTLPASFAFRWGLGGKLHSFNAFAFCAAVGCVIALTYLQGTPNPSVTWALGLFAMPIWAWGVVALSAYIGTAIVAWLFLIAGAFPISYFAFDGIATHSVHWLTADPNLDRDTKVRLRREWNRRYHFRTSDDIWYLWRGEPFLVIAATVLAVAAGTIVFEAPLVKIKTLALAAFVLLVGTALRCRFDFSVPAQAFRSLVHWFSYNTDPSIPPYVFRSPGGPAWWRQTQLAVAFIVWTFGILTLTDYCELRFSVASLQTGHWMSSLAEFLRQLVLLVLWPFLIVTLTWLSLCVAFVAPVIRHFQQERSAKP